MTTNNRSYRRSANSAQHVALSQMSAAAIGHGDLGLLGLRHQRVAQVVDVFGGAREMHELEDRTQRCVLREALLQERRDSVDEPAAALDLGTQRVPHVTAPAAAAAPMPARAASR